MTTYAVTGASGHLGRLVVENLLAKGVAAGDLVAVARTTEKVADLAERGVVVREGDYDRAETLATALAGVDRLLLVSASEVGKRLPQHTAVIEAAVAAGVGRIAYTSVLRADDTTLVLAPEHQATEEAIASSGLPHTLLRNGWYTENYTEQLPTYLAAGVIAHAAGDGRIAAATRADLAEAAAVALLEDRDERVVHELAGPAFTYADLAAAITEVTGTEIAAKDLPTAELSAVLTGAGLDEGTAGFLVAVEGNIVAGELDGDPADLEKLLGRPATTLVDAVRAARSVVPQTV
ncbi:SDR family oxidoreductase [Georgenia subflava]|uniref:NAD(P)H-binding protein n=1 Tax=Georgenia subflava TaxID=1622177 RepID=A0A6N7ECN4_9MICO|nr:SDR family oxidoreductase [Georgenia subflava]MPV36182.1 NAD(P)H-binding protein [Georgenia subflava]